MHLLVVCIQSEHRKKDSLDFIYFIKPAIEFVLFN